jgi:hypothetical protein
MVRLQPSIYDPENPKQDFIQSQIISWIFPFLAQIQKWLGEEDNLNKQAKESSTLHEMKMKK